MEVSEDIKKAHGAFSNYYRLNGSVGANLLLFQGKELVSFNITEKVLKDPVGWQSFLGNFKFKKWDKVIWITETLLDLKKKDKKIIFQEFCKGGFKTYWCDVVGNSFGEMEPIEAWGKHTKDFMKLVVQPSRDVEFALSRVCEALNNETWKGGMIFRFSRTTEERTQYVEYPFPKGALADPTTMDKFVECYSKVPNTEKFVLAIGHSNGKGDETEIALFEYTKDGYKAFVSEIDDEKTFGGISYADPKEFEVLADNKKIEFHSYFLKAVG